MYTLNREILCDEPCPPDNPCDECVRYWDRMVREGYWDNKKGWTDKALKEWTKLY